MLRSWSSQTKYLNRNCIKKLYSLVQKKKKKQKSKQFNLNEKLTRAKSNFDSNKIFSKLGFIHTHTHTYYLGLFILDSLFSILN